MTKKWWRKREKISRLLSKEANVLEYRSRLTLYVKKLSASLCLTRCLFGYKWETNRLKLSWNEKLMLLSSWGSKKTLRLWDTKTSERKGDAVEEGRETLNDTSEGGEKTFYGPSMTACVITWTSSSHSFDAWEGRASSVMQERERLWGDCEKTRDKVYPWRCFSIINRASGVRVILSGNRNRCPLTHPLNSPSVISTVAAEDYQVFRASHVMQLKENMGRKWWCPSDWKQITERSQRFPSFSSFFTSHCLTAVSSCSSSLTKSHDEEVEEVKVNHPSPQVTA